MQHGLSKKEVEDKLQQWGYNELPSVKPKSVWHIAFESFKEPMFILLICSSVLYMLLGDITEGIILLVSILLIVFITFYQHQKTEKALNALKQLSSPRALVWREGSEIRIPGREVVPDDIIILHEGDRIPADAKILESLNLLIDESMLTGESVPVVKNIGRDDNDVTGLIFSGTMVLQGKGKALVSATGVNTQFGKIGTSLQSITQESTRLQIEMKVLIRNLFIIGIVLSTAVIAAFYFTRGNFIQSLLNGLSAAMAILPEEFPVVLTVFLALGAWRLSKINVLTRQASVIETLGSATVLCSDKTGTITQNNMVIAAIYDGKETYRKEAMLQSIESIRTLLISAQAASQIQSIDPMEKAINVMYTSFSLPDTKKHHLEKEYPLSKELFAMTRVMKNDMDHSISVSMKGAPEAVMALCKLDKAEIERHMEIVNQMAESGYRVIAVANGEAMTGLLPEKQEEFTFQFAGLLGFEDPIRPEVTQAIKECDEAGIKVIMITGDYPATALSIARQIGLKGEGMMTGDELNTMNDAELKDCINSISIFARVVPDQKLRIVQALKLNNEIVAMTGDGVNDAPALKAANIGIAMGKKGTDVAREAASLVLLDDNFASIVAAIRSGRRIFDNLQKAMSFIIAIHIPIIGLTLIPAMFSSVPLLLLPLHIVFLELIIDPVCSVAFEYEQEEKGIMQRPPRNPDSKFFGGKKLLMSSMQGLILLLMVLVVGYVSIHEGHTEGESRAITFSALIIGNIFLILTDLSKTRSFVAVILEKNYPVLIILSMALIMLIAVISIPYLQTIFNFEFPGFKHFLHSAIGAGAILVLFESIKYIRMWRDRRKVEDRI